jgi:hypothetical protein
MFFIIDWSDSVYPVIRQADTGDSLGTVTMIILQHHLQAAASHYRAMERLIADAANQMD